MFLVAGGFLAVLPTLVAAQILAHPRSWTWGEVVGYCLPALGGLVGAGVGRRMKGAERRRAEALVQRAVWRGELPPGADPAAWRSPLRRQVGEAATVAIALLVLGIAGGAVTAVAAARTGHGAAGVGALAAGQEIAAVVLIWACLRVVRNGRRLRAES